MFGNMLLRHPMTQIKGSGGVIIAVLDQQPSLYKGTLKNRSAYLVTDPAEAYLSMAKSPDFAYGLHVRSCPSETAKILESLEASPLKNHFPCLSANFRYLLPFVTVEIKIKGDLYQQLWQLSFYATFYILSWLSLWRMRNSTVNQLNPNDVSLGAITHYGIAISPHCLQIWEFRPRFEAKVAISARLLCCGSPGDQSFMERVYVPWTRYVMRRGMILQQLHLVPLVRAYAAHPEPRPFENQDTVFLKPADFVATGPPFDPKCSSLGNADTADQRLMHDLVAPYEEAVRLASEGSKKRKSYMGASFLDSFTENDDSQQT